MRMYLPLLMLATAPAQTCSYDRSAVDMSDSALVAGANAVVLARVIRIEPATTRAAEIRRYAVFHFEVTETLKGNSEINFALDGFEARDAPAMPADFQAHRIAEFWSGQASNSVLPGDCEAYGEYQLNETYLIVVTDIPHPRKFENIRSPDDLWLQVIRHLATAKVRQERRESN